ncbi:EamA family transporter [Flavobacterium sp. 7A]|uniref:EamA family transporter n=1 Tax=Flavobacterium sp. 7A TaxID=2940571 RepID=UPI0022267E38|nr:DMT family transporter [Flavobacterium sp. 7A]MCW2121092.1 drug/metabolite transporter (DMT)-like permease [Flavobacterium sp. 7A]
MLKNSLIKGVFLVGLGSISYGVLATFVKMAYQEGYSTAEVTTSQFILGMIGLLIINGFQKIKNKNKGLKASRKDISQLMLAGTSMGFTTIFYYLSVKYVPVSIGIVLLMQTVWMSVILEAILTKKIPSSKKIISVLIVLFGTLLATNLLTTTLNINWIGVGFGLLAAASFTTTMFTANSIATSISSAQRSLYMLAGGAIIVFSFATFTQTTSFHFDVFVKWGLILSLFGTIIPPILMNAGFPITGIGLGSIISAIELPTSVMMAYFLLNEQINWTQWLGITLILFAIVIMNISKKA